ncbi:type 2 lanthipeptide synthetase LanM family protein [Clostridium beijerinckii]|uniref:type 2 lanthipeptide synthetase LanM family protein n=1 Tax=Clostridium beijerinckii TaxID=1520 RepID=UPI00156E0577|nr:type 2 lanthipeptide synthetase LanM family protein [Clostridium beijerinckii]NRT74871.1 type 2 lantibiotic biosynthesis protein LanM [Clostridium beijerinckii]
MENSCLVKEEIGKQFVRALTINERINIFKKNKVNMNVSNEYIENWKNRKSLISKESFSIKLEQDRISETEFNYALKEIDEKDNKLLYEQLKNSEWFKYLQDILDNFKEIDFENIKKIKEFNLVYALRPFIYWIEKNLEDCFENTKNISLLDETMADILGTISSQLIGIFQKTFISELHAAKADKLLKGETPEDRFNYFVDKNFTNEDDVISFYAKYATLTRILTVKTYYFIKNVTEAVNRFDYNFDSVKNKLDIDIKTNKIKKILWSQGDSHQKGKSVAQFVFEDNNVIIYKPKNLRIEEKYYKFINWFNENSGLLNLPINKAFYKEDFTFEAYIKHDECTSEKGIENFYERFGETLGIMYILCGNDLHFENIIASGEYPYIIDLETLFQNLSQIKYANQSDSSDLNGRIKIYDSVLSTSLLPSMSMNNNIENKGIDISGLNGDKNKYPVKVLIPVDPFTDNMRYDYQDVSVSGAENIPMLNGEKVKFEKYSDFIIKGFKNTIIYIMKNKDYLLSDRSILWEFEGILVRCVIKATQRYADLLGYSYHPSCCKDFIDREKLLENMWGYPHKNKEVVQYEVKDMLFDDVPIFFTRCDSKNLLSSEGNVIGNCFEESGLEKVINRIKNLDNNDMEKQISYMIVSFDEYDDRANKLLKDNSDNFNMKMKDLSLNKSINYLKESEEISKNILKEAVYSENRNDMTWIDVITNAVGKAEVATLTKDFYNGLSGLGLYYYYLYKITDNKKYEDTYKIIINSSLKKPNTTRDLNSYSGNCSLLNILITIYKNENTYLKEINDIYNFISENLNIEYSIDWLSGRSGLIQCMLNAYDVIGDEKYLELSKKMGQDIIERLSNTKYENLIGGMSHGASGISFSLFKLGAYTNEDSFTKEAIKLLEFDRSFFDKEKNVWIDKRKDVNKPAYNWCHGSIGIGMSRLMMQKYYKDEEMEKEIKLALKYAKDIIKHDDCLCHGNMGDVDFLLQCYEYMKDPEILEIINKKVENIFLFKQSENHFRVKALPALTSIGMFTGICGIGYELLRVLEPNKVPSVLTLEIK